VKHHRPALLIGALAAAVVSAILAIDHSRGEKKLGFLDPACLAAIALAWIALSFLFAAFVRSRDALGKGALAAAVVHFFVGAAALVGLGFYAPEDSPIAPFRGVIASPGGWAFAVFGWPCLLARVGLCLAGAATCS
jgi:hypothetical protein